MSDCANGGRNVYEPVLVIRVEFEGPEKDWRYPLALNGRKVKRVILGETTYEPSDFTEGGDDGQYA